MSHALNLHDGTGTIARDPAKGILLQYGDTVPAANAVGYAPGCRFFKTNATTIGVTEYVNIGTKSAANFVQAGTASLIQASIVYDATITDRTFFTADRALTVLSITGRVAVAGTGGACTATIRRVSSGTALASGTAIHTGTYNLVGTVDANQSLTLSSPLVTSGQSLAFDVTGTATSAVGSLTVNMIST